VNNLDLTRGDSLAFKFQRIDADGNPITTAPYALYLTVKESPKKERAIFQKRYLSTDPDNADLTLDEDGFWHGKFLPADTEKLPYGDYYFDIEVVQDATNESKKTVCKGWLKLTDESTWVSNETGA